MKTYRIDRSKWVCGGSRFDKVVMGRSQLLNPQGRMCCLGHICLQGGVSIKRIERCGYPDDIEDKGGVPSFLLDGISDSLVTSQMVGVNDDHYLTQRERESELKKIAAPHCKLVFFGKLGVRATNGR